MKSSRARNLRKKKESPPTGVAVVLKYFIDVCNDSKSAKIMRKVWDNLLIKNLELC